MMPRTGRKAPIVWRRLVPPLLVLVLAAPSHAARSAADAIAAGDQAYAAARLDEARAAYGEAVQSAPTLAIALCRLVRAESELGVTQKGDAQRATFASAVLGGVPKGASFANAETAFQKAIALEPEYVNHRVEYGRLLKELKRTADARRELEQAVALPATSSALDARYQADARALLEKLPR